MLFSNVGTLSTHTRDGGVAGRENPTVAGNECKVSRGPPVVLIRGYRRFIGPIRIPNRSILLQQR